MNADVYLFGDLGNGYTQYIDDNSRELFKSIASKSKANSQLVIHRDDTLMYYSYVRRLRYEESSNNRYIGISYVLNNRFIYDIDGLFAILEGAITTIVSRGAILEYTDDGNIDASVGKLYNAKSEFAHISAYLKTELDSFMAGKNDTLPPLDYSISTSEIKTFTYKDAREEIISALSTFPTVYIYKDENYENEESKTFANKLYRLNRENVKLRAENEKVLREKKRTTIVTILSIVVAVGIIIIIGFANRSSEQGRKIELLERDKKSLNEHVSSLAKDSVRFEKELSDTKDELNYQKRSAAQLKVDKDELEDELATANENIEAYKQTIDQQKKQLDEKEQAIANLRGQLRNQAYSSTPFQINITKIEVASLKKNKSLANKFGDCLLASDSYYIKVRMNYSCTSSGMKELTLDLYDVSAGTKKYSTEIERVNLYTTGTYEFNTYLGNKGKRLYAGIYRVVISYKGDVIKSEDFIIH